jgi:hypothetical protein
MLSQLTRVLANERRVNGATVALLQQHLGLVRLGAELRYRVAQPLARESASLVRSQTNPAPPIVAAATPTACTSTRAGAPRFIARC